MAPTSKPDAPCPAGPVPPGIRCGACNYDLVSLPTDSRCPECGRPITESLRPWANPRFFEPTRRWAVISVVSTLLLLIMTPLMLSLIVAFPLFPLALSVPCICAARSYQSLARATPAWLGGPSVRRLRILSYATLVIELCLLSLPLLDDIGERVHVSLPFNEWLFLTLVGGGAVVLALRNDQFLHITQALHAAGACITPLAPDTRWLNLATIPLTFIALAVGLIPTPATSFLAGCAAFLWCLWTFIWPFAWLIALLPRAPASNRNS